MTTDIKLCSVENCNKETKARGLCNAHYLRLWRHGDPLNGRTFCGDPLKFIEDAVKNPDPVACILWPFGNLGNGYGRVKKGGKRTTAHRMALIMHSGTDYPHLEAAHGPCHTPACINPLHLSWATRRENEADKKRDGTHLAGERHPNSKLTEREALKILQDQRLQKEIAADYGISRSHVSEIKTGKSWTRLTATA